MGLCETLPCYGLVCHFSGRDIDNDDDDDVDEHLPLITWDPEKNINIILGLT